MARKQAKHRAHGPCEDIDDGDLSRSNTGIVDIACPGLLKDDCNYERGDDRDSL